MRLELPGLHRQAPGREPLPHGLAQGIGHFRPRGGAEAGAAAMARVAQQGKLRNQQHFSAHILNGEVHFAVFVLKMRRPAILSAQ